MPKPKKSKMISREGKTLTGLSVEKYLALKNIALAVMKEAAEAGIRAKKAEGLRDAVKRAVKLHRVSWQDGELLYGVSASDLIACGIEPEMLIDI